MITLLQQKASFLLQPIVAVCKLAILPPHPDAGDACFCGIAHHINPS